MKITYDPIAKALYLEVGKDGIVKRTAEVAQDVFLDFDEENKLIGIEILNVEKENLEGLI